MKEQIFSLISEVTVEVLLALLSVGCGYLTFYLRQAASRVKAETTHLENQYQTAIVGWAIDRLNDVVSKTVEKMEQVTASDIRAAVKAGAMDRSNLLNISNMAYTEIYATIEPEARRILQETMGSFETYTRNAIEVKVRQIKASK